MGNTSHTPAPWRSSEVKNNAPWVVYGGDLCEISRVGFCKQRPVLEQKANAHLIAAAPELLEALEDFISCVENPDSETFSAYSKARKAIAKARGES